MYRYYQRLTIAIVFLSTLRCAGNQYNTPSFSRAVDLVSSGDRSNAKQMLDAMPDQQVVREGVAVLLEDATLSGEIRQFCFEVLAKRGAASTEEGYRLLVDGLRDPTLRRWSVAGLALVSEQRRGETVEHFVNAASRSDEGDPKQVIVLALGVLQRWGRTSAAALPLIEDVFHDPRYSDQERSLAAQAMLTVGPVAEAMKQIGPEDRTLVLGPIGFVGATTNGKFDGEPSAKKQVRAYVRDAIHDERKEVRELAFEALHAVYGEDAIVGTTEDGYQANPEMVTAVQFLANSEPDPALRERAIHWLDTLDQRVRNAVRKRERRETP